MIAYLANPEVWAALLTIIGVNVVLSGDNAVVIALACRGLSPQHQKWGIALGSGVAVVLRIIFTIFIAYLLTVPFLKLVGGVLLFWIGYKLALGNDAADEVDAARNIWHAVKLVVIADAVMSLDNVVAVAAAAKGDNLLLVAGLVISIPMVVYGATLLIKLIERFPVIVPGGAALIGYIGGEVMVTDPIVENWIAGHAAWLAHAGPPLGAISVIAVSRVVAPVSALTTEIVSEEAAAGAALFVGRSLLIRLAALGLATSAYTFGDAPVMEGEALAIELLHGLKPVLAAVVAIVIGEGIGWSMRRLRRA